MNREIKFKAVAINTGMWLESTTIAKGVIKRKANNYYFEVDENVWVGVVPESLGQFTGLKDKNGIEIYEGDILSIDGSAEYKDKKMKGLFKVVCELGGWGWDFSYENISGYACSTHIMGDVNDEGQFEHVEIIGNSYQNPDLLS